MAHFAPLGESNTSSVAVAIIIVTAILYTLQRAQLLVELLRYLCFLWDHNAHYFTAAEKFKGKVLAWAVPGRPTTFYIQSQTAMKNVMANTPHLDIKALSDLLHFAGWEIPMGQPAIHAADKQVHLALTKSKIGPLVDRFEIHFAKEIARHAEMVGVNGREMPLQTMGYRLIYRCVSPAVFGSRFPVERTRIQNQIFAENVAYLNLTGMLPVFPYWIWNKIIPGARRAVAARDDVKDALEKWEIAGGVEDASDNYKSVAAVLKKGNFSSDIKAKWLNTVQFGFLANTGETVGWFLLYVTQSPKLLAKIREEVDVLPADSLSSVDLKRVAPHLDSALHENFRLISATFAGRRVLQDTTIPGLNRLLPKGSLVRTMTRSGVFDKEIWGEDALCFRGDRFLGEEGQGLFREELVFGSGGSACPGRHFAIHELQVVFATLLRQFDFGLLTFHGKSRYDDEDGIFGPPAEGEEAELIDLDGTHITIKYPGIDRRSGVEAISGLLQPLVEPVCTMKLRR